MAYGFGNNPIVNYFKTSYEELSKVIWPTRQQATKHALMVIGLSLALAIFFGLVDFALSWALQRFIVR